MPFCSKCNGYMFTPERHICPPSFICEPAEYMRYGEGCDTEVCASSPEAAAEKFCEDWDSGGDYDIIRSGAFEVKVTNPRSGEVTFWDIVAESIPQYTAYAKAMIASGQDQNAASAVGETDLP